MQDNPNLDALIARRGEFEDEMSRFLTDTCAGAGVNPHRTAAALLDVVIRSFETRLLVEPSPPMFDKACVSRFGDGMVPILRDILGNDVPIGFLAHCIDGYWRGVRHVLQNAA